MFALWIFELAYVSFLILPGNNLISANSAYCGSPFSFSANAVYFPIVLHFPCLWFILVPWFTRLSTNFLFSIVLCSFLSSSIVSIFSPFLPNFSYLFSTPLHFELLSHKLFPILFSFLSLYRYKLLRSASSWSSPFEKYFQNLVIPSLSATLILFLVAFTAVIAIVRVNVTVTHKVSFFCVSDA